MPLGSEALLSQLLVQTHFKHDLNLRLQFSAVILWYQEKIPLFSLGGI